MRAREERERGGPCVWSESLRHTILWRQTMWENKRTTNLACNFPTTGLLYVEQQRGKVLRAARALPNTIFVHVHCTTTDEWEGIFRNVPRLSCLLVCHPTKSRLFHTKYFCQTIVKDDIRSTTLYESKSLWSKSSNFSISLNWHRSSGRNSWKK